MAQKSIAAFPTDCLPLETLSFERGAFCVITLPEEGKSINWFRVQKFPENFPVENYKLISPLKPFKRELVES